MMSIKQTALSLGLIATLTISGFGTAALANHDGAMHKGCHCGHTKNGGKQSWESKHKKMHQRFSKELKLTPEQNVKIEAMHKAFKEEHKAQLNAMKVKWGELKELKKSGKATPEELKTRKAAIKEEFSGLKSDRQKLMDQIKAVLTPEQTQKLETMKSKHPKHCGKLEEQKTQ